jgi:glutamyl-tRNA reductase
MHAIEDLVLVGMSQRTAPVAVREQYAVSEEDARALLQQLSQGGLVEEGVVLSTCNRTEILASTTDGTQGAAALRGALFRNVEERHIYSFRGVEAIMHLFRVASGLDSLVLGETEILGQLKRSLEAGVTGRQLTPLYEQAITVGKRVRRETSIGEGSLSVARVGLEVAARAIGRFEQRRAVVVGAGETGMLVARNLASASIGSLCLMNRTLARAAEAAQELGGVESAGLERLPEEFEGADLAVVCVDGAEPLVNAGDLNRKALAKRDQPLVVLDLSIPRAVSPEVAALDGVIVYDLDALLPVVEEHRAGRAAAAEEVTPILIGEVHKFLSLRTFAAFTPAIEELKTGFAEEREQLLDRITSGQATARELELAHAMERQLLHLALSQLKESARQTQSTAALERAYLRFVDGLPGDAG